MKKAWKTNEQELYVAKEKPEIIEIPEFKFFTIKGSGNPNSEEFKEKVRILYSLSYTLKMMPRKRESITEYFDFKVYPLEGIFDFSDKVKESGSFSIDEIIYKLMIRQSEFANSEIANIALYKVKAKNSNFDFSNVKFESIKDGKCVQMLHEGSYSEVDKTLSVMRNFIEENNLKMIDLTHREIYLNDPRKTKESKLKTTLRYFIK